MTDTSLGLHSSKRKFYKLLDNLSSSRVHLPPSHDNASTTTLTALEPPAKRSRFLSKSIFPPANPAHPATPGAKERPRSSIFSVNGTSKARPSSIASERDVTLAETKKTPNYAPWSHENFLQRLKTFADVRTWTPKPPAIGEVEWAKRGWVVVGKDCVGCKGGCEKRLVVRVADEENRTPLKEGESREEDDDWWIGDLEGQMVERYRRLIVEGHAEECLWRKAGCKEDTYRIKMADPVTWQTELRERYLSLVKVEGSLPAKLDIRPQDMDEAEVAFEIKQVQDKIPADVLSKSVDAPLSQVNAAETEEINTTALAMALTGWSALSQSSVHLAYCSKCFQRAGLWLYKSPDLAFNPIEQHREHCPWKNPLAQASTGRLEGMPGWQVLVTLIKGYRKPDGRSPAKKAPSRPQSAYTNDGASVDWEKGGEEQEHGDKERKSRLSKLKKALSVKRKKKEDGKE